MVKGISTLEANLLSIEVISKMIVELVYTDEYSFTAMPKFPLRA